jgi:hypothetical protein
LPVEEHAAQPFYDGQLLEPGYGYLTTRDGTRLSVFVALPGPPEDGPYPVLVNYSGYDPSEPVGALSFDGLDLTFLCDEFPVLCDAPNAPEALIAGMLGFATVGVNMRGTGCSGGAYDFFEPLQLLDGYDIIETVATQEWAGKVGMVGISFPGISQLFVASTQPPHLAAITPLAVISGIDTTMNPGGIMNNGFAVEWGQQVLDRADPYGHGWEQGKVDDGDLVCEENQLLHSQKVDIIAKAYAHPYYESAIYDPLNPRSFVDQIEVPSSLRERGRTSRRAGTSRICGTASRTLRWSATPPTTAPTPTASRRRCSASGRTSSTSTSSVRFDPSRRRSVRWRRCSSSRSSARGCGCPPIASWATRTSKRRARLTKQSSRFAS